MAEVLKTQEPPLLWKIQTDGEMFKWVRPNGTESIYSYSTKQKAITRAWGQFEHERRDKGTSWNLVE